ncbi:hypothetical protein [Stenotrophomonas sp.]|uniref:hypothetical protein n=1 Tax=Stenotrophomonas sp. TaxID=69392 RepID=UPI0028A00F15|nr:hypothetical protein [Stenotrophomonas sp.]
MTPIERSKWCIQQAEEIEAGLVPSDEMDGLVPIGYCMAEWFRAVSRELADGSRVA